MSGTATRIWLCADDYGISPAVSAGIRELIARGRLNATSVMVVAPSFDAAEAKSLEAVARSEKRATIGLHVTLTGPFKPVSKGFQHIYGGAFLTLPPTLAFTLLRRFQPDQLAAEVAAQIDAFVASFGRTPDFIDGHQHVQVFPQIRDAVLAVAKAKAPLAWVRQCGRNLPTVKRFSDAKGLLLDILSRGFRAQAAQRGVRTNPAFAGTYDFVANANFAALFPKFLDNLPDNSVIMCHPGHIDEELKRLDPLTTQREQEFAYFAGDEFPAVLAAHSMTLAH